MRGARAVVLAVGLLAAATPVDAAALIAAGGVAAVEIVVPATAIPAERTAARELADYLERATGARFEIVVEQPGRSAPAIFVGPTEFARSGAPAGPRGPESWRYRAVGPSLVLEGGRPRGTLYAVYRFLEDVVGVRWWTPYADHVPSKPTLVVQAVDRSGRPSFEYRDVHGLDGPIAFSARNRHSGDRSYLTWEWGGRQAYGPPAHSHDFFVYVPPEEYFATHPEFFSEIDGVRTSRSAQLCLTNPELRELVAVRVAESIEQARLRAVERGEPAPELFPLSQNDWGGACTCDLCSAVDEREGGHAGSLVEFLNAVAVRLEDRYPDALIDTLAYHYTFTAPRTIRLHENVVVRLSALQRRDFSKSITHPSHREYRTALDEWREVTTHLRIWDYSVTFGRRAELPLPNLRVIGEDFRYYLEHGIEGVFIQHDPPIRADMRDLKVWVVLKLLEEPYRDVDALIVEFTNGYYGAAAETIREYLDTLRRAVKRRPAKIGYPAKVEQYRYLDARFLREAQELFDLAEAKVAGDPELLARVRFARLSLDRATLHRWTPGLGRATRRGKALDPQTIAERYWATATAEILVRLPDSRYEEYFRIVGKELSAVMIGLGYSPPAEDESGAGSVGR